jgi:hypothetical protein
VRVPTTEDGIGFIQSVHRLWPALPVVAVTGYPNDLLPLQGRPEHPVLILTKPVLAAQVRQVLAYTLERNTGPARSRAPARAGRLRAEPATLDASDLGVGHVAEAIRADKGIDRPLQVRPSR